MNAQCPRFLLRVVMPLALCLVLCACALPQRGEFHGTRIDVSAYEKSRIGLLPIALNPTSEREGLPRDAIENVVTKALRDQLNLNVTPIPVAQLPANRLAFPMTSRRLSELSRELGFDGLVGISVSSWWADSRVKTADYDGVHLDLTLTYADGGDPRKEWTLSANWTGKSNKKLVEQMQLGLGLLLLDLRHSLGRSSIAGFFSDERIDNQPQLTYVAPEFDAAGTRDGTTDKKFIDLQITGIDDDGLASMEIVNERSGFRWVLPGALNDAGERPIFLSSRVRVPLSNGQNRIAMSAAPASENRLVANREMKIETSAKHEFVVFSIGLDARNSKAGAASSTHRQAASANGQGKLSLAALTNEQASRSVIDQQLERVSRRIAIGDSALVSVAGRVTLLGTGLFLILSDAPAQAVSFNDSVLQFEELQRLSSPEKVLALDFCSEIQQLSRVHKYLRAAIEPNQMMVIRLTDCRAISRFAG